MTTTIGQALIHSRGRLLAAMLVGIATVAADLFLVSQRLWYERSILPLIGMVALLELSGGDRTSLGFRITPNHGWLYWARITLWLGVAVAVVLTAWVWMLLGAGYDLPIITTAPSEAGSHFWQMCIHSPLLEEFIYRFALCVPLAILLRPWGAIMTSGIVFGLLHVLYGNPSPENAIGGFILAWAFLKSESIYVPLILHSLGNFCVLAAQVGGWYWLQGSA